MKNNHNKEITMNKHLRYSSHLLAILMMVGSMQSLTANRIYFSNESDKTATFRVRFGRVSKIHGTLWYYDQIEIYPHEHQIFSRHSNPDVEPAYSNTIDDEEIVVDYIRLLLAWEGTPSIYSSDNNPERDDVYVTHKGNGEYKVHLQNHKTGAMTEYDYEAQL